MINSSEWKEFRIGDIFAVNGSKTTSKIELEKIGDGKYPYITTQATNNGIAGYYNFYTEIGNCLTIDSAVLGSCFYQKENFSASDHVEILRPKNFNLNSKLALYFTSLLNKNIDILGYSYTKKRNQIRIKNEIVKLPVNNLGEIDFDFMENFIDKIEQKQRGILEFYKRNKANGGGYELNSKTWNSFALSDLFCVERGTRFVKSKRKSGEIPLATAGELNQGVAEFIAYDNELKIYENHLTIDMFCNCFYRNYKFLCDDNILVLFNKTEMSKKSLLFISSIINKDRQNFGYEKQYRQKTFNEHKIFLPTNQNGEIDFDFMENFIKAVQKECIKGVDSYLAKNIATTKQAISEF